MKMQMRFGRVAAVPDEPDDLTALYTIADLHADGARLQVGVERVVTVADVDDDVIAANRFERDRNGAGGGAGDVLRNPILHLRDNPVGDSQGVVAIRVIAAVPQRVAFEGLVLLVDFHPIDGEALRDVVATVHGNGRPAMATFGSRPIRREPDAAMQRRCNDDSVRRDGYRRGLERPR